MFFYKHGVYEHMQARFWWFFKHMLNIMLSLVKYYYVKHFFGKHEFFHTDYGFFCEVLQNVFLLIGQKCSKTNDSYLRPGGLFYYSLYHNNNIFRA